MNKIFGSKGITIVCSLVLCIFTSQLTFATSTIKVSNAYPTGNTLVYERSTNPTIGITPQGNAVGFSFSIIDEQGKVVKTGVIKSSKTFYLDTKKLRNGNYRFTIGNQQVQEFQVK